MAVRTTNPFEIQYAQSARSDIRWVKGKAPQKRRVYMLDWAAQSSPKSDYVKRLERLAKKYPPPQSWYDEPMECPFIPTQE